MSSTGRSDVGKTEAVVAVVVVVVVEERGEEVGKGALFDGPWFERRTPHWGYVNGQRV